MTFLKRHFPSGKTRWKVYLKIFLPMIAGSTLFALNGVVDNFMVGHIPQGVTALGAINSWTNILTGWFLGTAAAGSVVMAQFYHAKKYDIVRQVAKYRYILTMSAALLLAIIAWTIPDTLTKTFYSGTGDSSVASVVLDNAREYSRVIAIQWILISISFNLGNQLRELGYGKYTMYWGFGSLTANITLNATLMYGFNMGVAGAAWASVAGRIVSMSSGIIIIIAKKIKIGFKPWTIFNVSFHVQKLFWKRWVYFMSIFTVTFFVTYRNHFYDVGYVSGSLGIGVGGLSVVGLTSALVNIFITTFSSLASMSAFFVGSELGKGDLEQAKKNGDELKGFSTLMSMVMSLIALAFAFGVPYMDFLSESQYWTNEQVQEIINSGSTNIPIVGSLSFDSKIQLINVRNSMIVVALFYPIWIWFTTSYRVGNSGGKGGKFALVDWIVSGPIQLGWLAIVMLVIVPSSSFLQSNFWCAYALFFVSDFLKLIGQEILYYKYNWLNSLTKSQKFQKDASAKKYMNEDIKQP